MSCSTSIQPELIGGSTPSLDPSPPPPPSNLIELIEQGGSQLHLQIHIHVLPFDGPIHLWFQSQICLTLGEGGSNPYLAPPLSSLS